MTLYTVAKASVAELKSKSQIVTKVGDHPVVVFWDGDSAWAIEDRCPHLGFPLHRGTIEAAMVTCHWHHARFDLSSGCTLDPWADDAIAFDVELVDEEIRICPRKIIDPKARELERLAQGLQEGIRLVVSKSVQALLAHDVEASEIIEVGLRFGATHKAGGWSAGMTVLTVTGNLLPFLDEAQISTALTHGLVFLSDDVRGNSTRFRLSPLFDTDLPDERFENWYRRFIETSSPQAAERALTSVLQDPTRVASAERAQFAAATDHAYIDTGHVLDFSNKAFEALKLSPELEADLILTSLVAQTCHASRAEESSAWNHPYEIAGMVATLEAQIEDDLAHGLTQEAGGLTPAMAEELLQDDPKAVLDSVQALLRKGFTPALVAQNITSAAALRLCRFHTQNDPGDWNIVHHTFTTANAATQALRREPTAALTRTLYHLAAQVFLDRFLNVPSARLNKSAPNDPNELAGCWDHDGHVDEAGSIVASFLDSGGDATEVIRFLANSLLREDANFHLYQNVEAAAQQAVLWGDGSPQQAWPLIGSARFLAAHTPTLRTLEKIITTATRLRRGDDLFAEAG